MASIGTTAPGTLRRGWSERAPAWLQGYPAFHAVLMTYALWRFLLTRLYFESSTGHTWQGWAQAIQFFSFYGALALMGPLIFWTAHRFRFGAHRRWVPILAHGVAMVTYCGLSYGLFLVLHMILSGAWGTGLQHMRSLMRFEVLYSATLGWIFFLVGATFAHALHYLREVREHASREARLETQLAQSQLQQLKSQLQPHFLFNTHSAISGLMSTDIVAARRMLNLLSDFLRLSLKDSNSQVVPLKRELEFTDLYLEIQQLRFTDHLRVVREVAADVQDWPVPHLLLQPLVENALKHGIGPKVEQGTLWLTVRQEAQDLVLEVADDGLGPKVRARSGQGGGLGLRNAQDRLIQLYGASARLDHGPRDGGGYIVSIRIPARPLLALDEQVPS